MPRDETMFNMNRRENLQDLNRNDIDGLKVIAYVQYIALTILKQVFLSDIDSGIDEMVISLLTIEGNSSCTRVLSYQERYHGIERVTMEYYVISIVNLI